MLNRLHIAPRVLRRVDVRDATRPETCRSSCRHHRSVPTLSADQEAKGDDVRTTGGSPALSGAIVTR